MFKTARSASTPTECKNFILDALRSSEMHISTKISVLFLTMALLPTGCLAVENVCASDNNQPKVQTTSRRIAESSTAEKRLGVVLGLTAIYFLVSYRLLELRNDKNKERIDDLQTKVADYETIIVKTSLADALTAVRETPVFKRFLSLADKPLLSTSDDDWQQLIDVVTQQMPSFAHFLLSENGVSAKEFRLSVLALLSFKPGQMAVLTGLTNSDISQTRRRLLQKVFGVQGSAADYDKRIRGMAG